MEPNPHYVRIWADGAGVSHFDDVVLPTIEAGGEPGVPRLTVGDAGPVGRLQILDVDPDFEPDWHTAPRPQFVVFLTGWVRLVAGDGETRTLPAGSVVLAEDTTGGGHFTAHEPGERQRVLVIPLGDEGY
jgi:quercetin dioxygenase-like cupin family protein